MVNHYRTFDDYIQASNHGEELKFKNFKDIKVPDDTPEPLKVTIEEPKEKPEEKKPAKKKAKKDVQTD